ncbi:uncharacterized protein N7477_004229 [Penicillium maclennaniae]|uniref:uncharacterized protein n=1 Tax=Penicillium maclennaniae TaxID=1343394 RepID=UPI00253FA53B|nr:uncharacterized protein N7477_004229 [Penicillium maclennaniae]KAJ5674295.1 hypothetical protein N7477_004229 [Penicillium maclennaniae]
MSREQIIQSHDPRTDALNFVTNRGRYTLRVEEFIEAGRPDGSESHGSPVTRYITSNGQVVDAPAIKGISGHVIGTGQSFTIRDDYDFVNTSVTGKGYHVNAQLGKMTVAFTSGQNSLQAYYDRTNMAGERLYYDGMQAAASWYTQGRSR